MYLLNKLSGSNAAYAAIQLSLLNLTFLLPFGFAQQSVGAINAYLCLCEFQCPLLIDSRTNSSLLEQLGHDSFLAGSNNSF